MSRLPPAMQPLWPLAKRVHRLASLVLGILGRRCSVVFGDRRLPRTGTERSSETAALEPAAVTLHTGPPTEPIDREPPPGDPPGHWTFGDAMHVPPLERFVLEVRSGVVVGDYGAVITPGHVLDYETSEYFGIDGWREHPIFLRQRLPRIEDVSGSLLVLAARGGSANYYHFLLDVLPRLGVLEACLPATVPDAIYVPADARHERQLLQMTGLDRIPVVATRKHRAVRAERLLVPSLPNPAEVAPRWVVEWVRERLPAGETSGLPKRLYVTRGNQPNTRRLECEPQLWPELERRGFSRIDPGTLSVQEQIDRFAAADVVVGVHGAALTNLVFASPGVRVLHLSAPQYVKHCYWAILDHIPGSEYRYLVGEGTPAAPGARMQGIMDDVRLDPARILAAVDELLG